MRPLLPLSEVLQDKLSATSKGSRSFHRGSRAWKYGKAFKKYKPVISAFRHVKRGSVMNSFAAMRDELEKISIIGPAISAANLFIPEAIGYAVGRTSGRAKKKRTMPAAVKMLLVPGGIGHEVGYRKGLKEKKSSAMRDELEKISIGLRPIPRLMNRMMRKEIGAGKAGGWLQKGTQMGEAARSFQAARTGAARLVGQAGAGMPRQSRIRHLKSPVGREDIQKGRKLLGMQPAQFKGSSLNKQALGGLGLFLGGMAARHLPRLAMKGLGMAGKKGLISRKGAAGAMKGIKKTVGRPSVRRVGGAAATVGGLGVGIGGGGGETVRAGRVQTL